MARRILAVTEATGEESRVLHSAAAEARRDAAEILLVQVLPLLEASNGDHPAAPAADGPQVTLDTELTGTAQRLANGQGKGMLVRAADPADAIVHLAEEEHVDLIVCGNTGMRGRREFLVHNLPNRITHLARCDVMLVNVADDGGEHHTHFHHHRPPPAVADPSMFEGEMLGRATEIGRVIAMLGMREALVARRHKDVRREAQLLRQSLERLGPTFEKLGQMLSTRPDLLPKEFIDELATLQDDVPPLAHHEVVREMERELHVPWEDVFESMEPDPIAAGTIAQVHRAVLGSGEQVVVKVQRPSAEEEMCKDLALLQLFGERAKGKPGFEKIIDLPAIIDHLSQSLQRELDFNREADNIEHMAKVLQPFSRLAVPAVYRKYSTHRLLVMEWIEGVPLLESEPSPERSEAARQLVESYYQQVLTAGFFHADPHPGNLKWCNGKIYFLDFGMVGEIDARARDLLGFMLLAFWHEDVAFLADVLLMLAERHGHVEESAFRQDLAELVHRYRHLALEQFQLGPMMQDMTQLCVQHDIRMPASLALIGKALGQMQLAAATLDPGIDPFAVAGRFFTRHITLQVREMVAPERFMYNAQKIRLRALSVLDALERVTGARPGFEPRVRFQGTEGLEGTIRRAGRRLATAFVCAACFMVTGLTAAVGHDAAWVSVLFAAFGGVFGLLLLVDLLLRRG
ncbi:MAG TPA: AarF/UbiB family protein [Dehalococcoidia bacterium]|nr:AarF/UbiB family protein [Dehalococcoidia bacterium]